MKLVTLGAKLCRFWAKNNDTIELIVGTALVAGGTVALIKSADDISDVNEEVRQRKEFIKEVDQEENGWEEAGETRGHYVRETVKTAAVGYTKSAGIGVGLIVGGEVLQAISHATLANKLTAVAASLATVSTKFADYRQNVVEDQGEEKDFQYLTGATMESVELKKDGTIVKTSTPIHTDTKNRYIPHSFFFDEANVNYSKINQANYEFLSSCENQVNNMLALREDLTENDIRFVVGAPKTKAGAAAGVKFYNKDGSKNYISFGMERNTSQAKAFRNGTEPSFLVEIMYTDSPDPALRTKWWPISDNIIAEVDWELC
jgi:soluble cytochrome b562